jgi:ribosomal protein S18 acetylase RimI-like enzyme
MSPMSIAYREGNDLDVDEVIGLYRASTLGERRPVGDRERMALMVRNSNLVITAWDAARLVGISRAVTDFTYTAYLADLAVHVDYQRRGIGLRLIEETRARLGKDSKIVLLAAPAAAGYYPKIGFAPPTPFLPGKPLRRAVRAAAATARAPPARCR